MVGVLTSVLVIGWTLQFINRNYTRVQEADYDVTLPPAADAEVADGARRRALPRGARGRPAGIPDGTYLVDDRGTGALSGPGGHRLGQGPGAPGHA